VKVAVDEAVCMLNAECTLAAPDVFRIGDDGELEYDAEPSPEQEAAVREAIDACPTYAIELVEDA
jgi:ferredoxin